MEFSQIFGFSKILSKSIKLVLKYGKSMAANATLSMIISSILVLLLCSGYQLLNYTSSDVVSTLQFIIYMAFLVTVELGCIYGYLAISYTSSYSLRYWMNSLLFVTVEAAVARVMSNPNPSSIANASIAAVAFLLSGIYTSVCWNLSAVINLVVDDGCEAVEALDRARKLVEGKRIDGVMLNLFLYLFSFIIVFSFCEFVGDKGSLNLMVYGLFLINCIALIRIYVSVVHTVYYFRCMEYHTTQPLLIPNNILV